MSGLITDPWFWAMAVPAVLLIGLSKSGFGGGLGSLGVPLIALTMPVFHAAAILLPVLCTMDLVGCWAFRKHWNGRNLAIMVPGALIGITTGTLAVGRLSEGMVELIVGVIATVFGARHFIGRRRTEPAPAPVANGVFWGGVSGFTSFLAHAGSPPANVFLLPQRLDKSVYVGTTVMFFAAVNYMKLAPYAWLGQFSTGNLATSAALIALVPPGMWLGLKLHRRLDPELFYTLAYGFQVILGVKLIGDGVGVW